MKKYIYIFAFLGLSLCSQSCMDKLEILPSDQIITDNFFEKGMAAKVKWRKWEREFISKCK